ncbi:hypothetical protein QBC34DRAFT_162678 [Podospora aff. communis PSN243]|uniref:Uncharacterized protein n=1 Tax=Podospora aff. communis PSN243 TaxID=3040156 RepID=A0AAV9GBK7_9PEZI|nr:hypothetical protein QBC34DRAFT_162678 [Podospora aff. communis PSN243]
MSGIPGSQPARGWPRFYSFHFQGQLLIATTDPPISADPDDLFTVVAPLVNPYLPHEPPHVQVTIWVMAMVSRLPATQWREWIEAQEDARREDQACMVINGRNWSSADPFLRDWKLDRHGNVPGRQRHWVSEQHDSLCDLQNLASCSAIHATRQGKEILFLNDPNHWPIVPSEKRDAFLVYRNERLSPTLNPMSRLRPQLKSYFTGEDQPRFHRALENIVIPRLKMLEKYPKLRERLVEEGRSVDNPTRDAFRTRFPPENREYLEPEDLGCSVDFAVDDDYIEERGFRPHFDGMPWDNLINDELTKPEWLVVLAILHNCDQIYDPGQRYLEELRLERRRVRQWVEDHGDGEVREYFGPHRAGQERINIIARRSIRDLWSRLHVWNENWGIPPLEGGEEPESDSRQDDEGREANLNDDCSRWKWPWEEVSRLKARHTGPWTVTKEQEEHHEEWGNPVCWTLRSWHKDGFLRSSNRPNTWAYQRTWFSDSLPNPTLTRVQAQEFICTRPWYVFTLRCCEEFVRHTRAPKRYWKEYRGANTPVEGTEGQPDSSAFWQASTAENVYKLWKRRGDWQEEWGEPWKGESLIGWF